MTPIKPKFLIMAAGFRSGSLVHKNCCETRISIPALIISGTTDEVIPFDMSQLLESGFVYPKVVHHAGGHFFPYTANEKSTYIRFFQNQLQAHLEDKETASDEGDDKTKS